jgi:cytochrome b561
MALKSTSTRWGLATRVLHWSIALAVFGMFAAGFYAVNLDHSTPAGLRRYNAVINVHKSCGLLVLMKMVVRVLWRLSERTPKLPSTVPAWERITARAAHFLLYVGLFVMPISGYLMVIGEGEPVQFFGLTLPRVLELHDPWAAFVAEAVADWTHHTVAFVLLAIVVLHVLGALKNHVIDRNDVLRNMAGLAGETVVVPEPVTPADPTPAMPALEA